MPEIIVLQCDTTLSWPCRSGDFLLWLRYEDIFAGKQTPQILDFHEMRQSGRLTITNRLEDLPPWFELHPTEITGSFVYRLIEKIEKGDYPQEPMDGPSLWRLNCGDRLAWIGVDRPGLTSVDGVLAILDCGVCALAFAQGFVGEVNGFTEFSASHLPDTKPEDVVRCQRALEAVQNLGAPRAWGSDWSLC